MKTTLKLSGQGILQVKADIVLSNIGLIFKGKTNLDIIKEYNSLADKLNGIVAEFSASENSIKAELGRITFVQENEVEKGLFKTTNSLYVYGKAGITLSYTINDDIESRIIELLSSYDDTKKSDVDVKYRIFTEYSLSNELESKSKREALRLAINDATDKAAVAFKEVSSIRYKPDEINFINNVNELRLVSIDALRYNGFETRREYGMYEYGADKCASSYNIAKLDDPMGTVIASINAEFEITYN